MSFPLNQSTPYDADVNKITSAAQDDWAAIMEFCDKIKDVGTSDAARNALISVHAKVCSQVLNTALRAIVLLHACTQNCGRSFVLRCATEEYSSEIKRLLQLRTGTPAEICTELKKVLVAWDKEFSRQGREYSIFARQVRELALDGHEFPGLILKKPTAQSVSRPKPPSTSSSATTAATDNEDDEDMRRAIELSLQSKEKEKRQQEQKKQQQQGQQKQQQVTKAAAAKPQQKETFVVRALYNFAAKESNELEFKEGAMISVTDASHDKWWSGVLLGGANAKGFEGLFPSNFVERVANNGDGATSGPNYAHGQNNGAPKIDVDVVDRTLELMTNFDPSAETPDTRKEMESLIKTCTNMQVPVAEQMKDADERKKKLIAISTKFNDVMDLYELVSKEQEQMAQQQQQQQYSMQMQQPSGHYSQPPMQAYTAYGGAPPPQQSAFHQQQQPQWTPQQPQQQYQY